MIVGTGSIIPIDGTVLGGEATVNEAAMTGESVSVVKGRGAVVLSGTLVEEAACRSMQSRSVGVPPPPASPNMSNNPFLRRARRSRRRPGWPTASSPPC